MRIFICLSCMFLFITAENCNNKEKETTTYKGKLEIKGICMNYTISLPDGHVDTAKFTANWTDEVTGKQYVNVFGLGSPCSFPATIKEGDEFYFTIDPKPKQDCAVCMAYYPSPPKKLSIKVIEK